MVNYEINSIKKTTTIYFKDLNIKKYYKKKHNCMNNTFLFNSRLLRWWTRDLHQIIAVLPAACWLHKSKGAENTSKIAIGRCHTPSIVHSNTAFVKHIRCCNFVIKQNCFCYILLLFFKYSSTVRFIFLFYKIFLYVTLSFRIWSGSLEIIKWVTQ